MRTFIKKITHPFLKTLANFWFSKDRTYKYNGIEVLVHPNVFPPHYTISTKIILDFIKPIHLKHKTFLELGCGSGIIALYAASKEAKVTASDINKTALEYLGRSSKKNNLPITILYSNLFDNITDKTFDYIIINPPYYQKKAKNIKEKAWFCGENFEYFEILFKQLSKRHLSENIYMILSEDCEIKKITKIANDYNIDLDKVLTKKVINEKNFIFNIKKSYKKSLIN